MNSSNTLKNKFYEDTANYGEISSSEENNHIILDNIINSTKQQRASLVLKNK